MQAQFSCGFLLYLQQLFHFKHATFEGLKTKTIPEQFFSFYLHIYLFIYSSFSSTFFTDISPGSVGVLVNGESHVSVSQVSEVTMHFL